MGTMNLRKKHRSAEVSLDECSETEEGWLCREVPDNRATPEESCSQQELYRLLTGVIEQLRPSYRVIVQFRYVKGFSAGETSRQLGLPVSTVKTRLHRARLQLRKMFNQHSPSISRAAWQKMRWVIHKRRCSMLRRFSLVLLLSTLLPFDCSARAKARPSPNHEW